jgi:hypothetical protein
MISTNRKVDSCYTCYLGLTTIVEPLNLVWMGVNMCHQANLCHKISTHQIVATSTIDDGANAAIFDDEENLEYVTLLKLLGKIHIGTQDLLHDIGLGAIFGHKLTP